MHIHNEAMNAHNRSSAPEAPFLILGLTHEDHPVSLSGHDVTEGTLVCGAERRDYLASLTAQTVESGSGFIHLHTQGNADMTRTLQAVTHHMGCRDLFVLDLSGAVANTFPALAWNPLHQDPQAFFAQLSAHHEYTFHAMWEILLNVWRDKNPHKPLTFSDAHQWFQSKSILLSIPSQSSLSVATREAASELLPGEQFPEAWTQEWDAWEKTLGLLAAIPAFQPAPPLTFAWETVLKNKLNVSVILPSAEKNLALTQLLARVVLDAIRRTAMASHYDTAPTWTPPMLCLLDDAGDYFYNDLTADVSVLKKKGLAFVYGIPDMAPFREDKNRALAIWRNTGVKVFLKMHDTETFIAWINPMLSHISSMSGHANTSFAGLARLQNEEAFLVHRNDVVHTHWMKTLMTNETLATRKCIAYPKFKPEDLFK